MGGDELLARVTRAREFHRSVVREQRANRDGWGSAPGVGRLLSWSNAASGPTLVTSANGGRAGALTVCHGRAGKFALLSPPRLPYDKPLPARDFPIGVFLSAESVQMSSQTSFRQQCPSCEAMVPIKDASLVG